MSNDKPNGVRRSLTAGIIALTAGGIAPRPAVSAASANFPVFDALLFRGKPNLSHQGLLPITAVAEVWRPESDKSRVDEAGVMAALARLRHDVDTIFIDIEGWLLLGVSATATQQSVANYCRTAELIRRNKPQIKFGFYGIAPSCTYWPIALQDKARLAQWRAANRALRPLANWVDFVLPSLYTFYDDPAGWRKFATASLEEARQYGKPVYPFLWNEYFDGNPTLGGHQVKLDDWRDELLLCREQADGIVLWGGYQKNWSESADWWQAVLEFRRKSARAQRYGNHAFI